MVETFIHAFNEAIGNLDCGVRVRAVTDDDEVMEIVDLDGKPMGRVPKEVEPEAFVAFVRIVEQAFEDGVKVGRAGGGEVVRPTFQ